MTLVPAWRIAAFHPARGKWILSVYEYPDQENALSTATFLVEKWGFTRAELIPCETWISDHGVNR